MQNVLIEEETKREKKEKKRKASCVPIQLALTNLVSC